MKEMEVKVVACNIMLTLQLCYISHKGCPCAVMSRDVEIHV